DLDALQRRAETDPAWFWGAAADDIAIPWQRRPTSVFDMSRGVEWSRWWAGGAFNYAAAAIDPRADRDPDGEAVAWEGEDGAARSSGSRRPPTPLSPRRRPFGGWSSSGGWEMPSRSRGRLIATSRGATRCRAWAMRLRCRGR